MDKIALLALDLDGTTLTDSNTLTRRVKSALERAIKSGLKIVAASGRPHAMLPKSITDINGMDYVVTSNGAAIYDFSGKRLYSALLDEEEVIKYLRLTEGHDLIMEAFIDGKTYTDSRYIENPGKYGCSQAYFDYVRAAHGSVENMREFIYRHRKELDSVELVCADKSLREALRKRIEESTSKFYITSSSENFVEITDKNASKGNALLYLSKMLGISLKNTAACGNADNDADMIRLSGLGAAVENSTRLCKESAKLVVPSNNSDGVASLIDYILEYRS